MFLNMASLLTMRRWRRYVVLMQPRRVSDRRIDRRTPGHIIGPQRASIASRGKKIESLQLSTRYL